VFFSKHLTGKIQVNHPLVRSGIATSVKNPSLVMMMMMMMMMMVMVMMMMMMMMTMKMTMTMMMAFYFTQVGTFDCNHLIILRRSGHPATRRQHHTAVGESPVISRVKKRPFIRFYKAIYMGYKL